MLQFNSPLVFLLLLLLLLYMIDRSIDPFIQSQCHSMNLIIQSTSLGFIMFEEVLYSYCPVVVVVIMPNNEC
ncbi:hypothetical protein DERP_015355 [Dermatophagoides pteronyssinus]|uniref:Secreted protein n=1 Tax=Dermatophagoides pteronyssinus TaxID=6956 RepID=A0ABQ8JF45_DERPT|nr:hypothetical protein DERP_015355 [Dermatophagoides pteronyssinus]